MADNTNVQQIIRNPGSLLELERRDARQAEALWHGMTRDERLRAILSAGGADRERLITLAQDSAQLVRAMAADEFAGTVLELGGEDAGGLIAMSSDEQLTYLLDLTGWVKEKLAPARYEAWVPIIIQGGTQRVKRWLDTTDVEVLALIMAHWLRVVKWLASQDEQEPPDDLPSFTLDGVYFIDFHNKDMRDYAAQVMVVLKNDLPVLYQRVLESMLWESAAGMAEDASMWRSGRMADLGFPTREEAFEIWAKAPPGEDAWQKLATKDEMNFMSAAPPRSDASLGLLPKEEMLPVVAGSLEGPALDRLRAELTYVANCGVVALDADPADPDAVARSARESLGLANIGLGLLSEGDPQQAKEIVARMGITAMARQGAHGIRNLNARAWALATDGWLSKAPGAVLILDEPLDRWVAGLMFPRPRCYDPAMPEGREYRAFLGMADLQRAEHYLSLAEYWGELLEMMGIDHLQMAGLAALAPPEEDGGLKMTAVVGTWLAGRALGLAGLEPIPAEKLGEAVNALQNGLGGSLDQELLASVETIADIHKAALAGDLLRGALDRLAEEINLIDTSRSLEGRYVASLVVE